MKKWVSSPPDSNQMHQLIPVGVEGQGGQRLPFWSPLVQEVGVTEEERVFIKQVKMETRGDIDIFNYLQIYSNFLLFLTTPPTESLMGVLNKEAWRSQIV